MPDAAEEIPRNEDTDYERSDTSITALLLVAIVIVVLIGVAPVIIRAGFPTTRGDVDRRFNIAPPAPRLQTNPPGDLDTYLNEQHSLLNSYAWIDREKGIAREPVAVAMQRLAHDGIDGFPKQ